MRIKKRYLSRLVILIAIMCFISCKKYPENTLWLKNPEKNFKGGKFTSFKVNGVDSMPMWERIYNTPPNYNGLNFSYNPRNIEFAYDKKEDMFSSYVGNGSLKFISKKKKVSIFFYMSPALGTNPICNIFYTKDSEWDILKLDKKGTLKIQRTFNNKTYEIQIN